MFHTQYYRRAFSVSAIRTPAVQSTSRYASLRHAKYANASWGDAWTYAYGHARYAYGNANGNAYAHAYAISSIHAGP